MNEITHYEPVTIAGVSIRRDAEGRYCLNDLHDAAGGEYRHRPNYFLNNQQTLALVAEIEKAGIPAIKARQRIGTFACKELVYAYAMWISPPFHIQVVRTFDAVVTGQVIGATGLTAVQVGGIIKAVSQKQHEESERRLEARFRELQAHHRPRQSLKKCLE